MSDFQKNLPSRIDKVHRMRSQSHRSRSSQRKKRNAYKRRVTRNYILVMMFAAPILLAVAFIFIGKSREKDFETSRYGHPKASGSIIADRGDASFIPADLETLHLDEERKSQELISAFRAASSWEEMSRYVHDPSEFLKATKNRKFPNLSRESWGLVSYLPVYGKGYFISAADSGEMSIATIKKDETLKVDWRAFLSHCSANYDDFRNGKIDEAVVRVNLIRNNYYNFFFKDDTQWLVFTAENANWNDILYLYYPRSKPLPEFLNQHENTYATLRIQAPDKERGVNNQFLITEFIGSGWIGYHE